MPYSLRGPYGPNAGRLLLLGLLVSIPWAIHGCAGGGKPNGGGNAGGGGKARPEVVQTMQARLTARAFGEPAVTLPVFEGPALRLVREGEPVKTPRGFVWRGKVEGEAASEALFTVAGDAVVGRVQTGKGKLYQVATENRRLVVREIDWRKFPPDDPPPVRRPPLQPNPNRDTCTSDPPTDIDVMVLYTDDARAAAGGADQIEASVYQMVAEANQSYINSNVTFRLRLCHTSEVSYSESGNSTTDVTRLHDAGDGHLDTAQTLRDTHAADIVMLVVSNLTNACGEVYEVMGTVNNAFESRAFGVVDLNCGLTNRSFTHEVGHLFGARHDWPNDSTNNSPYVFNHGYRDTTVTAPAVPWRTIMATSPLAPVRLNFWSNPNVNDPAGNEPMGVATGPQQCDNHRALNESAATIANFRCSSPGAPSVWMRDTWADAGGEPDSNTAGQAMWKSPYIWVRNTQDAGLTHQHEHQNPAPNQPLAYVYAKLHNGGNAAANGTLELYFANASVSLTWPASWTLLASVPVNNFASRSTRVVEGQWANVPAAGHYCLLARWVSAADPMTSPEGASVEPNVRNNNNIVWRNLDIVPLGGDVLAAKAEFEVANPHRERPLRAVLAVRAPADDGGRSFLRYGRVGLSFDGGIGEAWNATNRGGAGFKVEGEQLFVSDPKKGASFNLVLPPGAAGKARITFERAQDAPKQAYAVDVILSEGGAANEAGAIGGVSYEVRTDPLPE